MRAGILFQVNSPFSLIICLVAFILQNVEKKALIWWTDWNPGFKEQEHTESQSDFVWFACTGNQNYL